MRTEVTICSACEGEEGIGKVGTMAEIGSCGIATETALEKDLFPRKRTGPRRETGEQTVVHHLLEAIGMITWAECIIRTRWAQGISTTGILPRSAWVDGIAIHERIQDTPEDGTDDGKAMRATRHGLASGAEYGKQGGLCQVFVA